MINESRSKMSLERKPFNKLIQESEVPILVDVYSETCGPCQALKPVLKELKNKMGDDLRIVKVNGPNNMGFMQDMQISAFPTLILYNNGKQQWRHMGYTPLNHLEKMVRDAVPA